jgi:hypothetical protein
MQVQDGNWCFGTSGMICAAGVCVLLNAIWRRDA